MSLLNSNLINVHGGQTGRRFYSGIAAFNLFETTFELPVPFDRIESITATPIGAFNANDQLSANEPVVGGVITTPATGAVTMERGGLDNPAAPTLGTASTGGTLTGGVTYGYKVTATNASGETAASAEATIAVPAGTNTNTVTITAPTITGATGYKFYGRTNGGPWGLLAMQAGAGFTDTGGVAPGAAPPSVNSTAETSGMSFSFLAIGY